MIQKIFAHFPAGLFYIISVILGAMSDVLLINQFIISSVLVFAVLVMFIWFHLMYYEGEKIV